MGETMDTLTLTDDEAVVLAAGLGGAWRPLLPTVDPGSETDLTRAMFRGRRSLAVRDLTGPDGAPLGIAAEVAKRLGIGMRAVFLLADEAGDWLPGGLTVCLYGCTVDAVELSHVVAAAGVHYFRIAPPPGLWQSLTGLAETIYASGVAADAAAATGTAAGGKLPAAAYLHVHRPDGTRSVRVSQGTVTTGRGPVPARFPGIAEATAWLLA
jgi:hypothetical protein